MVCVVVGWLGLSGCGDDNKPGGANKPTLQSISIAPGTSSIAAGATVQLTATGTFSDGTTQDLTTTATWTSSGDATATVSATGLVTGVAAGSATITASSAAASGTAAITVTGVAAPTITSIAVTPPAPTIVAGQTAQLVATATLSDGTTQVVTHTATWSSGTLATATVDDTGLVTAVAAGTSTVSAAMDGVSGSTTVTVTAVVNPILLTVDVTPKDVTIGAGGSQQYTAIGTFSDGTTKDLTGQVIWLSTDFDVASIEGPPPGLALTHTVGTTTIRASFPAGAAIQGETTLTVTAAAPILQSIAVTSTPATVAAGNTAQAAATGTFNTGGTQDLTAQSTWSSDNTAVATVDATGLITSVAAGTANITASSNGITSAPFAFVVTAAVLKSIAVTPASVTLLGGQTQQYTATATFSDGTTQDVTATATWASNASAAKIVAKTGLATAVAVGTANITATLKVGKTNIVSPAAVLTVSAPSVINTNPADGDTDVNLSTIQVTFDQAVVKTSLTTQTADGPCTGNVQLSADNFTTCVGFSLPSLNLISGNVFQGSVTGTITPGTTYKLQVVSSTSSPAGKPGLPFVMANGFTTVAAPTGP